MALPTADMGFPHALVGFCAVSLDPHAGFQEKDRAAHFTTQPHVLAGISQQDPGNRTVKTQPGLPIIPEQTAFFVVSTPVVIPIKIAAFLPRRCLHRLVSLPVLPSAPRNIAWSLLS